MFRVFEIEVCDCIGFFIFKKMNSKSGWRKGKKQKYFPSKVPKRMGNIAEFNKKKVLF